MEVEPAVEVGAEVAAPGEVASETPELATAEIAPAELAPAEIAPATSGMKRKVAPLKAAPLPRVTRHASQGGPSLRMHPTRTCSATQRSQPGPQGPRGHRRPRGPGRSGWRALATSARHGAISLAFPRHLHPSSAPSPTVLHLCAAGRTACTAAVDHRCRRRRARPRHHGATDHAHARKRLRQVAGQVGG